MTTESAPVKEGSAEIQFDSSVFYNPIQEFNRDMSVAAIKVWSEMFLGEIYTRKTKQEPPYKDFDQIILPEYHGDDSLKRKNLEKVQKQLFALNQKFLDSGLKMVDLGHSSMKEYHFSIMEGLAASGLRSIRYAKEISNVKEIIANDYSRDAVEAIKRNAERNGVSGLVKAVQGDASQTLYKALGEGNKYSVIDLDPYGSAAPFLDGAIQAVKNGGLLCVTCTDMAVLAGPRPEVCFAKYGGVNIPNAPFTHELALRILLHSLQTIASRYRRSIEPVLSCSIDYYVRVFIRVFDSPIQTKKAARYLTLTSKTSMVYFCPKCKSFELVPIGKYFESEKGAKYGPASIHVSSVCTNCQGKYQIGGPFYSAPLHSPEFLTRMIGHIGQSQTLYGTWTRMAGMLQVISEEIDEPLYYILSKLCSTIHCSSPKLPVFISAIINAGYKVSQSHAIDNSVKTNAPSSVIWDILRNWTKITEGEKPKKYSETSPAQIILQKQPTLIADFTLVPESVPISTQLRLVRFQENPTADWGPQSRAGSTKGKQDVQGKRTTKNDEVLVDSKKLKA